MWNIFTAILVFLVGIGGGYGIFTFFLTKKIGEAESKAKGILKDAEHKSNDLMRKAEQERKNIEFEKQRATKNLERLEEKFLEKEERMEKKLEYLETEKEKIYERQRQLDTVIDEQKLTLSKISNLSENEAKDQLFDMVKSQNERELVDFINKFKSIKQEEAKSQAAVILSHVLPRIAMNDTSEFTVSTVDLPSEDTKGKIIGREGRNISFFERLTGVELLIDDTPMAVKVSSFDPEKRYIAGETLRRLIKDGRINPIYIEKIYNEIVKGMDEIHLEKGKEALSILGLGMFKPEIVKMIGQFNLRYSYGQNLWIHSIEVAKIAEGIANELGLDGILAKKAGLLHDIGKIAAGSGEGHAKVGADILRKHGFNEVIVNAAEGHHFDVELTDPISWIVTAADAVSAGRPGARYNTKELFIDRMGNLEKLITSISGIDKVYIMQAGREIMVFVNPDVVTDLQLEETIKSIGSKIEDQLDYPGVIRIMAIRESRVVSYLR